MERLGDTKIPYSNWVIYCLFRVLRLHLISSCCVPQKKFPICCELFWINARGLGILEVLLNVHRRYAGTPRFRKVQNGTAGSGDCQEQEILSNRPEPPGIEWDMVEFFEFPSMREHVQIAKGNSKQVISAGHSLRWKRAPAIH